MEAATISSQQQPHKPLQSEQSQVDTQSSDSSPHTLMNTSTPSDFKQINEKATQFIDQQINDAQTGKHPDFIHFLTILDSNRIEKISDLTKWYNNRSKSILLKAQSEKKRLTDQKKLAESDMKSVLSQKIQRQRLDLNRDSDSLLSDILADIIPLDKNNRKISPCVQKTIFTSPFTDWLNSRMPPPSNPQLLHPNDISELFYQYKNDSLISQSQNQISEPSRTDIATQTVYYDTATQDLVYGPCTNTKAKAKNKGILRFQYRDRLAIVDQDGIHWPAELIHIDPVEIHVHYDQGEKVRIDLDDLRTRTFTLEPLRPTT